MKDWRGVEVHAGDTVVWAGRQGSSLNLAEGKVLEILGEDCAKVEVIKRTWGFWKDSKKTVSLSGTYMTVITCRSGAEVPNDAS